MTDVLSKSRVNEKPYPLRSALDYSDEERALVRRPRQARAAQMRFSPSVMLGAGVGTVRCYCSRRESYRGQLSQTRFVRL